MKTTEFKYTVMAEFDYIIEEQARSSTNLRKVAWGNSEPKYDLRKWDYSSGEERPLKGVTFTDDGINNLAVVLVQAGFGDINILEQAIIDRKNGKIKNRQEATEQEDVDVEYYDPEELLA